MGEGLGRDLVGAGLVTEEQLQDALQYQGEIGGSIAQILVKLRHLKEQDFLEYVSKSDGLEIAKLEEVQVDEEIMAKLPRELVEKHELVPLSHSGTHLRLAIPDPSNLPVIDQVSFRTGLEVQVVLISSTDANRAIGGYYGKTESPPARVRQKTGLRSVAREVGGMPDIREAIRAVAEIDASPAKLIKALASLLVDRKVISAHDLKERVRQLGQ